VRLETSLRWHHRFLATAKDAKPKAIRGIVEADETFILKSAKRSKQLVGRAPRKRGGTAKIKGLSTDEHDCILIVRDRSGTTTAHVHDLRAPTFAAHLDPVTAKYVVFVGDGRDAYDAFVHAERILQIPIIVSRGEHVNKGFHIQNVNAHTSASRTGCRPSKASHRGICPATPHRRSPRRKLHPQAPPSGLVSMHFSITSEQSRSNREPGTLTRKGRSRDARSCHRPQRIHRHGCDPYASQGGSRGCRL
jgi:hypothetical protein